MKHLFAIAGTWGILLISCYSQQTAFLYQGQLTVGGFAANGSYDFTFSLVNASGPASPTLTNLAVPVSNGLFSVALDFGGGPYNGSNLWLQIGACTNGAGAFTTLTPNQPVCATPYAVFASVANSLAAPVSGDGSELTNVNAALLGGVAATNYATVSLLSNYVTTAQLPVSSGSSLPNFQVFSSPGVFQFTAPSNVSEVMVEVWGAGGGGGGGGANSSYHGSGGGAGGYGKGMFAVTPGSTYTVTVGAGGAAGTGTSAGTAGGSSSFGNLISASGGAPGTYTTSLNLGGAGGTSTGPISITGGAGQWTFYTGSSDGGTAGNGGAGGRGDAGAGAGAGQAPGGGGGGGEYDDSGAAGADGRVIISY